METTNHLGESFWISAEVRCKHRAAPGKRKANAADQVFPKNSHGP